jgi:transaldolase
MSGAASWNAQANRRPPSKVLVDGGDPEETIRMKNLLGFVDGQTTNPSLVAKNPEVARLVSFGQKPTETQEAVDGRSDAAPGEGHEFLDSERLDPVPLYGRGTEGGAAVCGRGPAGEYDAVLSQSQAAAVYAATRGSKAPVYVSPFVGCLDDIGQNGIGLIRNIRRMYAAGDGHVLVLAASTN